MSVSQKPRRTYVSPLRKELDIAKARLNVLVDMFKHPDFFRYNSRNGVVYFANTPGVKLAECIKKLVRRYLKVQGRRIPIS